MLGLRPRMDFVQGTVGVRPLVSWQALRESTYVEPHQGIKHEYASAEAVRRAAVWLEKAGLIQMRSRDRQLIFFLPFAEADKSVRKIADRGPTDQANRRSTREAPSMTGETVGLAPEADRPKRPKADGHPVSESYVNPLPPTPREFDQEEAEKGEGGQGGISFTFPSDTESRQKAAVTKKLSGLGLNIGQAVLDEWLAAIQAGGVKAPQKLLDFFINQAKSGLFMSVHAVKLRQARHTAEQLRLSQEKADQRMMRELDAAGVKGKGKPDNLAALVKRRSG